MLKTDLIKDKGVIGLVDEYLRLKDVVRRARGLTERARRFDRVSSSIYAILSEVNDIVGDEPKARIPSDRYSSGHRDSECWAKLYGKTREIALAKQEKYLTDFPPQGYDTRAIFSDWVVDSGTTYYFIHMTRMHSCD